MKAYKVEILVNDHDELGSQGIKDVLENIKYPNWCMNPQVIHIQEADIGEWDDDHPLNQGSVDTAEINLGYTWHVVALDNLPEMP